MTEPYNAPNSNPDTGVASPHDIGNTKRKLKIWKRVIWISLAGVILPIVIGAVGIVIGMSRAFEKLEANDGNADPNELAGDISYTLQSSVLGILISLLALVVLIVALVKYLAIRRIVKRYSIDR